MHSTSQFSKRLIAFFVLFNSINVLFAQDFFFKLGNPQEDHKEIIKEADAYFKEHGKGKGSGWKQYSRWLYELQFHLDEDGNKFVEKALPLRQNRPRVMSRNSNTVAANWQELGPDYFDETTTFNAGVGRINDIKQSSTNPSLLYAASSGGGLWKTENGGESWTPKTDNVGLPSDGEGFYSIALDPNDDQHLIIHLTGRGFLETKDGGDSWEKINSDYDFQPARVLTFHPNNSDILFYGTEFGYIYKSTDGGSNWELKNLEGASRRVESIEFKPSNPDVMYVNANGFYKSTNGGDSFSRINGSIKLEGSHRSKAAVTPANPDVVYVVQSNYDRFDALYKSTNSGETFTKVAEYDPMGSSNYFARANNASGSTGLAWYAMAIAVSQTDENDVSIACINVWRSLNGGSTFNLQSEHRLPTNIGFTHADIHHLNYSPNNKIWCGSDGGVYSKTPGEELWTNHSNSMGIRQIYKVGIAETDPNIVAVGSQDNGHTVYNDDNLWVDWIGADGMEVNISPFNSQKMYAFNQFGGYLHTTTNGGESRGGQGSPDSESGKWVTPMELSYQVEDRLYLAYSNVYRRDNRTYTKITDFSIDGENISDLAVSQTNDNVIYFIKASILYQTQDGGGSWSQPLGTRAVKQVKIHPANSSIVAVIPSSNNGDVLLLTENGFDTHSTMNKSTDIGYARTFCFDYSELTGMYVATGTGEIYYTDKELANWEIYNHDLPQVAINDLKVHSTTGEVFAGTYGRGLWKSNGYATKGLEELNVTINFLNPTSNEERKDLSPINFLVDINDSKSDVNVTKVVFSMNGNAYEDDTKPYNFIFTPDQNGDYSVTAKAFAGSELVTKTISRNVTVNEEIVQACSAPAWEAKVYPTKGTLISYENKIYSSKYYAKPQHIPGTEQYGPWVYVEDCSGNTGSNIQPKLIINNPLSGSNISGNNPVSFEVSASDENNDLKQVNYFINGETIAISNEPYSFSWDAPESGTYTLSALAIDEKNAESVLSSVEFSVGDIVPNIIPTIVLSPSNETTYNLLTDILIETEVSDEDGEVAEVKFKIGDEEFTDSDAPFEWLWTPSQGGPYTIEAIAIDNLGGESVKSVSNIIFRTRPTISSLFPVDGTKVNAGNEVALSIIANDLDGEVVSARYYINNVMYEEVEGEPFSTTWTPTEPGSYTIKAQVEDNEGRGSAFLESNITVEAPNQSPIIESVTPVNGSVITGLDPITITVIASDPDGIIESVNLSTQTGNRAFTKNGNSFTYVYDPSTEGQKFISLFATDDRGEKTYTDLNLTFEKEDIVGSCTDPEWNTNTIYSSAGNRVSYSGNIYENKWYTKGDLPSEGGPWRLLDNCDGSTIDCSVASNWSKSNVYSTSGTTVKYEGKLYTNQYYTKGDTPGIEEVWSLEGICSESTAKSGVITVEEFVGIFPNPSSGIIELNYLDPEVVYLDIFTTSGYQVMGKVYQGIGTQTINLSDQPSGSYVFVFKTASQILRQTVQIVD